MATIRELARRAEVSVATVSRVFNNPDLVTRRTREHVLRVADELGYQPNESARTLATGRSRMVGLVWDTGHRGPGWRHPFLQEILIGLKTALSDHGHHLLMLAAEPGAGGYARAAKRHDLDGIVFIDAGAPDPALADLAASGLPCVALDRPVTGPRATYVTSDNVGGARAAVAHLHARGRRRIATIAGPRRTWPGADRLAGYRLELSALGLPYREELVAEGDFYLDSGHAAMRRLLAPDERPDAVFAAGDQMAIGALRALAEAGLRVPEDVALVGFDDIELAALVPPGLTTVAQDKTAFGTAAARALIAMLPPSPATPHPPAILPTRLVIRGTT